MTLETVDSWTKTCNVRSIFKCIYSSYFSNFNRQHQSLSSCICQQENQYECQRWWIWLFEYLECQCIALLKISTVPPSFKLLITEFFDYLNTHSQTCQDIWRHHIQIKKHPNYFIILFGLNKKKSIISAPFKKNPVLLGGSLFICNKFSVFSRSRMHCRTHFFIHITEVFLIDFVTFLNIQCKPAFRWLLSIRYMNKSFRLIVEFRCFHPYT